MYLYFVITLQGEMCYAFVSYFPRAGGFDQCVQYDTYDQCDNYNQQSNPISICQSLVNHMSAATTATIGIYKTELCLAPLPWHQDYYRPGDGRLRFQKISNGHDWWSGVRFTEMHWWKHKHVWQEMYEQRT
jgi:hypothetical protein